MCTCRPFYLLIARTVTAYLACFGLALSPAGAKTPPASVDGHILTAASSTGTLNAPMYATINSVTGNLHRLPTELPKPSPQEPDR